MAKRGNPNLKPGPGRPKQDRDIVKFKETTYKEFIMGLQKYGSMTREQITADLQRPEATMFELMFGKIVASAAAGDKDARAVLIDRLFGKVKEDPMFAGANAQVIIQLPPKD